MGKWLKFESAMKCEEILRGKWLEFESAKKCEEILRVND